MISISNQCFSLKNLDIFTIGDIQKLRNIVDVGASHSFTVIFLDEIS
jgi:hypothetical protein